MLNLPVQLKFCLAPTIIFLLCILFALGGSSIAEILAYNRSQLELHQLWRLITAHFLHTNTNHLLLNLAGLVLMWALHGRYYKTVHYVVLMVVLCLGTSILLYLFSPHLQWYVGLSGVLHGLFVVGAYLDTRNGFKTGWIMLIGVWVKVAHEQYYGASADIAGWIEANVAIDAHLFGTLIGTLILLYYFGLSNYKNQGQQHDSTNHPIR